MDSNPGAKDTEDEVDGRERERFPFFGTCQLIPIDRDGKLLRSQVITIVGIDLSTTGMSFSHDNPLSSKRALIAVQSPDALRALEVEIIWSKHLSTGLYESDCRFLRALTKPAST